MTKTDFTEARVKRAICVCLSTPDTIINVDEVTDDSLEKIEIGIFLEDEFGIEEIDADALQDCKSLTDYVELVEKTLQ